MSYKTWSLNPQYKLTLAKDTEVNISLFLEDEEGNGEERVSFSILKYADWWSGRTMGKLDFFLLKTDLKHDRKMKY